MTILTAAEESASVCSNLVSQIPYLILMEKKSIHHNETDNGATPFKWADDVHYWLLIIYITQRLSFDIDL